MLGRIDRLRAIRWFGRTLISRLRKQSPNTKSVSLTRQLSLALRGFLPEKHAFYQFDTNDWRLYVNDIQMLRSSLINQRYRPVLDDKLLFEIVIGRHASVAKNLVLVRNAQPFWLGSPEEKACDLPALIRQKQAVIAKPVVGSRGGGVQFLEFKDGCFLRNGIQVDESRLNWSAFAERDTLVSEYIQQGSFANDLYPKSVNTIRILTMQDPDTQSPFIAGAIIRIGRDKSAPVDNVSSGGLFCNIEAGSGKLSKAVVGFSLDGPARRIEHHPDTGVLLENQVIPQWTSICEQTIALAAKLPLLPYIGWDVAILDDGTAIIEANSWSDLASIQMGRPLLKDPRVRKFFEYHNVL